MVNDFGPDAMPVVRPQIPAPDSACGHALDFRAVIRWDRVLLSFLHPGAPVADGRLADADSLGESADTGAAGFDGAVECVEW